MPTYFAKRAFLPDGWAHNVRFSTDHTGTITNVSRDSVDHNAERLSGPVLPGIPNVHSHAFQRAMAGLAEVAGPTNDSFWTWRELMYKVAVTLTPEQMETVATYLYIELLKSGYTTVGEFHYLHHDRDGRSYASREEMGMRILNAANTTGIGVTLLPVLYSHGNFGGQPAGSGQRRFINNVDDYLSLHENLSQQLTAAQQIGICFHSLRAVTHSQIETVMSVSSLSDPVHIHIAEQQREVDDSIAWCGQRPLEWLYDHVEVDDRWCLIHATHAEPHEVSKIAQSGATVGLCPVTEANLGDGIFPATDFLSQGGRFGIGSDSHICVNPTEELRWIEYAQRLRDQQRNCLANAAHPLTGENLYRQSVINGARALGQQVGCLAEGYRADLIVLDQHDPYISALSDHGLINHWVFGASHGVVRDVMVAGKWVVQDGHHPSEQHVGQEFARVLRALAEDE